MTLGCGMDPIQPLGSYFEYHISIAGPDLDTNNQPKLRDRTYFVRLPMNYDRTLPYPVVYLGPGCGGNTASDVLRLYAYSMNDAILVAVMPLPEFGACFDESINSVEYPFFDALHKKVESSFCVDPDQQFYAGFSTGARLGYMLDCVFPGVLRATASVRGGLPQLPTCRNHPIAMFNLNDTTETGNPYSEAVKAAQGVFAQNGCVGTFVSPMPPTGCGTSCTTYDPMASPLTVTPTCVRYVGCPTAYPIIFCSTTNQGQVTFEPWVDQAIWNFFTAVGAGGIANDAGTPANDAATPTNDTGATAAEVGASGPPICNGPVVCKGDGLATCVVDPSGSAVYGPTMPCAPNTHCCSTCNGPIAVCHQDPSCPLVPAACSGPGTFCLDANTIATCAVAQPDASGFPCSYVESQTPCPSGKTCQGSPSLTAACR
jgi:hypothetical protein